MMGFPLLDVIYCEDQKVKDCVPKYPPCFYNEEGLLTIRTYELDMDQDLSIDCPLQLDIVEDSMRGSPYPEFAGADFVESEVL